MTERKSWKSSTEIPLYCSNACRRLKNKKLDQEIESAIIEKSLSTANSFCPSEIARALFPEEEIWRINMERVRCAARRLFLTNKILILQKNQVVKDISHFKGPIRLKKNNAL